MYKQIPGALSIGREIAPRSSTRRPQRHVSRPKGPFSGFLWKGSGAWRLRRASGRTQNAPRRIETRTRRPKTSPTRPKTLPRCDSGRFLEAKRRSIGTKNASKIIFRTAQDASKFSKRRPTGTKNASKIIFGARMTERFLVLEKLHFFKIILDLGIRKYTKIAYTNLLMVNFLA